MNYNTRWVRHFCLTRIMNRQIFHRKTALQALFLSALEKNDLRLF